MPTPSTRTTGNEPADGIDPGGTRPTKPGNPDKSGTSPAEQPGETVVSGDQNQPASERAR